mmetsp:Transcript_10091/g.24707  ORF Transcript_10091/g.24707 Transcript_10091/m.24707 type:complete len:561 (+) Transcript_10091:270-1952(+)
MSSDVVVSGCVTDIWEGNPAWSQPNFCASLYATGLIKPRGLHIDDDDEILVVERGRSRVVRLDNDGADIVSVAGVAGLNHGIELADGYLYASTPTTVYRWPYEKGQTTAGNADNVQEVIVGMDRTAGDELGADGGHTTRTLAFDSDGRWLYVSIGSLGNIDADSFRSRIRRFDIAAWDAVQPLNFNDGEVFADGLRNEVGLAFDSHGDLWGVENGADNLYRDDLGGDIHHDNPSEELNRFREEQAGEHWGYPYCWSEYCLPVENGGSGMKGANTPWAWRSSSSSGYTDEWCRENTNRSAMSMPAHSAPLGIAFYNWRDTSQDEGCVGGFPRSLDNYAFIAFHGSWNRSPPTGYKVVFVPFDTEGNPTALPIDLFRHGGNGAKWPDRLRPVDVQFDSCGRLFVTEDGTGTVIKITYGGRSTDDFVTIQTDVADGASCTTFQPPTQTPSKAPTHSPETPPTATSFLPLPADSTASTPSSSEATPTFSSQNNPPTKMPTAFPKPSPPASTIAPTSSPSIAWALKPVDSCCKPNSSTSTPNSFLSRFTRRVVLVCVVSYFSLFY